MADNANIFLVRQKFHSPQINLARSASNRMWLVNICAFMAVIQSSLTDSYSSLLIALSAVSTAVLTEFLILHKSKRIWMLMDGSAVASALILTLLLPNRISPLYAAAGAVFAIAVIKHSFGGLGSNWLNPAAGAWLFILFSWSPQFWSALEGSPLSVSVIGESLRASNTAVAFGTASSLDAALRSFLNRTVFSLIGAELPEGYMDLFASRFPGIIADRGVFALLLGTIIITASQVNRAWIPIVYLGIFGFLVRLAGAIPYGTGIWNGDVLFTLCSGGTLVAAFFLSADPATGAKSNMGILLATLASGGIAFVFRCFGDAPYGAVLATIIINAILPLVRVLESWRLYNRQELYS